MALYQLHYADPSQIYQILYNLGLLPSVTVGWYVYVGNTGSGGGGGGGNRGGGGGGSTGGGSTGGGGGGGGSGGGGGGRIGNTGFGDADQAGEANAAVRDHYMDPMQAQQPLQAGGGGGATTSRSRSSCATAVKS